MSKGEIRKLEEDVKIKCLFCPLGWYSQKPASTECISCPAGYKSKKGILFFKIIRIKKTFFIAYEACCKAKPHYYSTPKQKRY